MEEEEPDFELLENPARVLPAQVDVKRGTLLFWVPGDPRGHKTA